ncbi:hypothetical protein [Ramlibacter sp. AN1133]|uniref:hypothetical protein n=1 Tax=Ramlibacter sp. AN1133 TaxID=3133429 RepID=UPI0030C24397
MHKNNMPALLGALALCVAAPASAALYRCGNVFQDRPCDAPVAREVSPPAGGTTPAARRPASAASAEAAHGAHEPASSPARPETAGVPAPAGAVAAASAPARKGPPSLACPNLRDQRTAIETQLRAASRPETTRMYERQLRGVERNLDEGNCR